MQRIAEKHDLINTIAVKVWAQAGISSRPEHNNPSFLVNP
jgi:hypothetical protein